MEYQFTPEQDELRTAVRRLLANQARPRSAYDGGPPVDRALWRSLAATGALALGIDEADGGSGGGLIDQIVVGEELGRAAAPVPYVAGAVLAAAVMNALGSPEQRRDAAQGATSGERVCAVALTGPGTGNPIDAVVADVDGRLRGRLPLVLEGAGADLVLVAAGPEGNRSVYGVPTDDPAVTLTDLPALDRTRRPAELILDGVAAEPIGRAGSADAALTDAWRRGCVALAADATGAAAYALELSADYARDRQQFGRPIGMFQAVKHKAADMLVAVENARSATYFGAWEVAAGSDHADVAAAVAKATATEHAVQVVGDAVQIHGGIAITWEHDLHLYLRRVKTDERMLGTPDEHLDLVADHVIGA